MMISKEIAEKMYGRLVNYYNEDIISSMAAMPGNCMACRENLPTLAPEYYFIKATLLACQKYSLPYNEDYEIFCDNIEPYVLEYLAK